MSKVAAVGSGTAVVPFGVNGGVYVAPTGEIQLDVRIDSETVWLTQAQLAELFGVDVRTINEHLVNIYRFGELGHEATIRNFRIVRQEGRRQIQRNIGAISL